MKNILCVGFLFFAIINSSVAQQMSKPIQQIVFITQVQTKNNVTTLSVDYVTMLTGNAAIKAARQNNDAEFTLTTKGDTTWYVPNDYYIENTSSSIITIIISHNAEIYLIKSGTSALIKTNITRLSQTFNEKLYKLFISGNKVIKLQEIYTP